VKSLAFSAPEAIRHDFLDHAFPDMEPFPAGVFFSGQIQRGENQFPLQTRQTSRQPIGNTHPFNRKLSTGFPAYAAAGCLLRLSFSFLRL
jgi:hypothetical protein